MNDLKIIVYHKKGADKMFKIHSEYSPSGNQPEAVKELVSGINDGKKSQLL